MPENFTFNSDTHRETYTKAEEELNKIESEKIEGKNIEDLQTLIERRDELLVFLESEFQNALDFAIKENSELAEINAKIDKLSNTTEESKQIPHTITVSLRPMTKDEIDTKHKEESERSARIRWEENERRFGVGENLSVMKLHTEVCNPAILLTATPYSSREKAGVKTNESFKKNYGSLINNIEIEPSDISIDVAYLQGLKDMSKREIITYLEENGKGKDSAFTVEEFASLLSTIKLDSDEEGQLRFKGPFAEWNVLTCLVMNKFDNPQLISVEFLPGYPLMISCVIEDWGYIFEHSRFISKNK